MAFGKLTLSVRELLPPMEGAGGMLFEKSSTAGLGVLEIGLTGSNCSLAFAISSLTGLFTFGLGVTGEAWMSFSTRLILAVGAGLCLSPARECENLTTPKTVSTIRCTAIEAIHAQNATLPLRQIETVLCFIDTARKKHSVILLR